MFCNFCGTQVEDGAMFCSECGAQLPVAQQPAQAMQPAHPQPIMQQQPMPQYQPAQNVLCCPNCHGTNISVQLVEVGQMTTKKGVGFGGHARSVQSLLEEVERHEQDEDGQLHHGNMPDMRLHVRDRWRPDGKRPV